MHLDLILHLKWMRWGSRVLRSGQTSDFQESDRSRRENLDILSQSMRILRNEIVCKRPNVAQRRCKIVGPVIIIFLGSFNGT